MTPLGGTLRQTGLFDGLDDATFEGLVAEVEQVTVEPGQTILHEGEVGDAVYVVQEGMVQVFSRADDGSLLVLRKLGPGGYFGEQALLPGRSGRRNASVRAHSRARLLRLRQETFQHALAEDHPLQERLLRVGDEQVRDRLLRQSRLFRSLELGGGEGQTTEETFQAGDVLFREGAPADQLYVIVSGTAAVYRQQEGQPVLLARLGEGQCVGELALLTRSVRAATVVAEGPLHAFRVSAERFHALHARSPELREYMQTLERVYRLPRRGFITQHAGRFLDRECITTLYHLLDGRQVAASRVVGPEIFNLAVITGPGGADAGTRDLRHDEDARGVARELRVSGAGEILGLTVHGSWSELGELCLRAIDGRPLTPEQLEHFRRTGACGLEMEVAAGGDTGIVCNCVQVDRGTIQRAVEAGARRLDEVQRRTSCGTVCGGCVPLVLEILGQGDWTEVVVEDQQTLAPDIRSFQLRPRHGSLAAAQPGQHVVVQARIRGRGVQRPYTLSSAGGTGPASGAGGRYEITVKREPHGSFSRWLFEECPPGGVLRVSPPQGRFGWEPRMDPVIYLAAGIGITPALAVCRTIVCQGLPQTLHLDYSARSAEHFAGAEELRAATRRRPNVHLTFRETAREGRLGLEAIRALVERYPGGWFLVCGPGGYLESVTAHLAACGVPRERIRVEVFVHSGDPPVSEPEAAPPAPAGRPTRARPGGGLDLFVPPVPAPARPLRQMLARLLGGASSLARSRLLDWRIGDRPVNPVRLLLDPLVARAAGLDESLPKDHLALLGILSKGPLEHQLESFTRFSARYGPNRSRALAARRAGTPLPPSTPDGDTFTYTIPNMPLVQFEGPRAVNTGWTRVADGPLVPVYVTRSRPALRALLANDPAIDRGPLPYHYFQQVFGSPSVIPDACRKAAGVGAGQIHGNSTWESQRHLTLEMVGPAGLARRVPGMTVALAEVTGAIAAFVDAYPDQVIDATELMSRIAYHVMIQATFGDLAGSGDMGAALRDPMRRAFQFAADQLNGQRGDVQAFHAELATIHGTIGRMIAGLREASARGALDAQQQASPIVRLVLDGGRAGSMDEGFVPSFVIAFIFGGHETTGFSMAWALYELGRNPALLAAVREEIDAFTAAHGGRPITPAQYDERPYTLALMHELGRRHPPIHTTARTALRAGEVPPDPATGIGAFRYPKDALLLCAIAGAHMDPDTYPDPQAFRAERFLAGVTPGMSLTERGRQVQANARRLEEEFRLLPFSAGPGGCVGRGFNTLEIFMVLDELLGRFAFELEDPRRDVTESDGAICGPAPGQLRVRIRRRGPGLRRA